MTNSATHNKSKVIRCRRIEKTYGYGESAVYALRGVDLDVYANELLLLVGPSGCGKTTFLSIIGALIQADKGLCEVLGQDLNSLSNEKKSEFRSQIIGFVFQAFNLLPAITALENIAIPLLIQNVKRQQALARAAKVLATMGLAQRASALPGELSGGEKQRIAIARAMVHKPKIILCDEPTSNLDHQAGHMVMQQLRHIVDTENVSLIVVTHDSRTYEFADRIATMEDGKIIRTKTGVMHEKLL